MSEIITVFRLTRIKNFFVLSRQHNMTSRMYPFSNDQRGDRKRRCSLKNSTSLTLLRTHISLIWTVERGHVGLVLVTYGVVMLRGDDFADCKDSRNDYTHQQVIHPASVCPVLFRGGGHVGLTSDPHASAHSCLYLTLMLNADFLYNIHRAYVELISSHLVWFCEYAFYRSWSSPPWIPWGGWREYLLSKIMVPA